MVRSGQVSQCWGRTKAPVLVRYRLVNTFCVQRSAGAKWGGGQGGMGLERDGRIGQEAAVLSDDCPL